MRFEGLVSSLLNEFDIALLEVMALLPNSMERLGSVVVGSLLLNDFIIFQYVSWLFLGSQGVLMYSCNICCF